MVSISGKARNRFQTVDRIKTHLGTVVGRRTEMELSVMTVRHPSHMHEMVHCASVLIFSSIYICQHDLQNLW